MMTNVIDFEAAKAEIEAVPDGVYYPGDEGFDIMLDQLSITLCEQLKDIMLSDQESAGQIFVDVMKVLSKYDDNIKIYGEEE